MGHNNRIQQSRRQLNDDRSERAGSKYAGYGIQMSCYSLSPLQVLLMGPGSPHGGGPFRAEPKFAEI